jgi:hypothetical protein
MTVGRSNAGRNTELQNLFCRGLNAYPGPFQGIVIFTTSPNPIGGGPNPTFDT